MCGDAEGRCERLELGDLVAELLAFLCLAHEIRALSSGFVGELLVLALEVLDFGLEPVFGGLCVFGRLGVGHVVHEDGAEERGAEVQR